MRLDDDSLDRAILALPLEEPPADLRASILAATVYRPEPPFTVAEVIAVASIVGILVWLSAWLAPLVGVAVEAVFSNVTLLLWAGAGIAVAFWLEFFTRSQPIFIPLRRAKGHAET